MSDFNGANDTQAEVTFPFNFLSPDEAKILLQKGIGARRGRPVGSTVHDRESFLKQSVAAYAQHFNRDFTRPRQVEIAVEIGVSRHTFLRYLRRYGILWADIQNMGLQAAGDKEKCDCNSRF